MSQLQVTGEAKIRAIQGPVVANSGVITALDGVASQYVRGDGTLANFPTSGGGGGGSVSYYLNGSVNQGNINGSVYYQMSKTPVIGAGTNFSISNNDLIAQFITDANDPSLLEIPAGNWNLEMYFNASSNGGNPSFYVELYKYNTVGGFTLISSSSATPEGITNGTTIDLYTTALAVPNTALTVTDRIMLRIFVNNSGRTITLHTENSHLCQVITTFTTGITALNGLTKQVQYLAVGTSGTDFNIVSSGSTHTFNIPSADGSNRGLVTTGTQSFGGNKSFGGTTTAANLNVSGVLTVSGNLSNGTYSYTLPSAAGQLALTSQIPTITGTAYIVPRFNAAGTALENSSISDTGTYTGSPTGQVIMNSRLTVNNYAEVNRYLSIAQNVDSAWALPSSGTNLEAFITSASGGVLVSDTGYLRPRKASDDTFKRFIIQGDELILNDTTSRKTLINKAGPTQTTTKLEVAGYARFDNSINVIGALYLNATDASQDTYFSAPSGNLSLVTSGTILLRSGGNTGVYIANTGFVGINGATPTVALTVSGDGSFTGALTVNGLINNTYSNNTFLGLNIRNTNTGDNALSGISIQNSGGTTVGQINYVSTVYANPTLRDTLLINTVFDNKLAFGTNSGGGTTRADIYFTVNPAFTLDVNNPNQIHILGTSKNVIINYSGTDFGAKFQVNGTTRLSDALTGTSATFSSSVTVGSTSAGANVNVYSSSYGGNGLLQGFGTDGAMKLQMGALGNSEAFIFANTGCKLSLFSGGNTTMTLTSAGNVGIGTSSPTATLQIGDGTANSFMRIRALDGGAIVFNKGANNASFIGDAQAGLGSGDGLMLYTYSGTSRPILFYPAGVEAMRITSGGNVGIGTSAPVNYTNYRSLHISGATSTSSAILYLTNSTESIRGLFFAEGTANRVTLGSQSNHDLTFITNDTERMRITSGGDVLIGSTSSSTSSAGVWLYKASGNAGRINIIKTLSGTLSSVANYHNGNYVGGMDYTDTTTTFVVASDYRLKQDLRDYNGLNLVSAIKTYDYEWKSDKTRMYGVIAHEFAEVLPYAVRGEKDGEEMQGVDYSKIVPVLVKAIQELKLEIEQLKNK